MAEEIKTEHLGYVIRYAENEDVWRCWDLDMEAPTLSALKRKMDTFERKRRKKAELVELGQIQGYSGIGFRRVHLISVDKPVRHNSDRCWITADDMKGGDGKRSREKADVKSLVSLTPENIELGNRLIALRAQAAEIARETHALEASIPRLTRDDLLALGVNQEEDDG